MNWLDDVQDWAGSNPAGQIKVSVRTLSTAIEDALMDTFTRTQLEVVLRDELHLEWQLQCDPEVSETKRDLVKDYTVGWNVRQYVGLGQRLLDEYPDLRRREPLQRLLDAYHGPGGVQGSTKNLIFAANGPKPDLVLRDAVNNDIQIVKNADYCLVYDQPIPAEGLTMRHLAGWWRKHELLPEDTSDLNAARALHVRLRDSLASNQAELVIFDAYQPRYKHSLDIPALIPQVYLHYDPKTQTARQSGREGAPLARQRMDFLLLFSDRRRVVIEVDGKQHYAEGDIASPRLYSEMVAEDRRLRLAGYEVFRFGGMELFRKDGLQMVADFFEKLSARMSHG